MRFIRARCLIYKALDVTLKMKEIYLTDFYCSIFCTRNANSEIKLHESWGRITNPAQLCDLDLFNLLTLS